MTTPSMPNTTEIESLVFHHTLVESEAVIKLCYGAFLRAGQPLEMIRVSSESLELWKLDTKFHCVVAVSRLPLFATILNAVAVPYPSLSGSSTFTDAILVATDSGHLTLLRYEVPAAALASGKDHDGEWVVLDSVAVGRSGARVTGAGLFLSVDSHSRAVMVGAAMKQKRVYPLITGEGDDRGQIRFGSGLDCSRPTVLYESCAVEGPLEQNCMFATIESGVLSGSNGEERSSSSHATLPQSSEGAPHEKYVSFYEFSASLNLVSRVMTFRVAQSAHALIPVPCDSGPGGILICTDQDIQWESFLTRSILVGQQGLAPPSIRTEIPRRSDLPVSAPDPMIIASCVTNLSNRYFMLIQNELGDLYRVEMSTEGIQNQLKTGPLVRPRDGGAADDALTVRYFDTIPPARHLVLFKRGYLATASESAPHALYRVTSDGKHSGSIVKRVRVAAPVGGKNFGKATLAMPSRFVALVQRHFKGDTKKPELRNLKLHQVTPNSAETMAVQTTLDAQNRLWFTRLTGRSGQHAAIHAIRFGIPTQLIRNISLAAVFDTVIPLQEAVSLFGGNGSGADGQAAGASSHNKLVFSSPKGTVVVRLEDDIQPDATAGFLSAVQTLAAAAIAEGNGYVQVHPKGISLVGRAEPSTWTHPQQKLITAADCNSHQVVASFDNGGLTAFDMGISGSQFNVTCSNPTFPNVKFVSLAPRLSSGAPGEFVAVCHATSGEVSVLQIRNGLRATDVLRTAADSVQSILLTSLDLPGLLTLLVGLHDGRLLRVELDATTGKRASLMAYACGNMPTRVSRGANSSYCLVQSSELWRCYSVDGAFKITPVILNNAALGSSGGSNTPVIAAAQRKDMRFQLLLVLHSKMLSIVSVNAEENRVAGAYHVTPCPLNTLTGRRLLAHPTRPHVHVALCNEYRGYNPQDVQQLQERCPEVPLEVLMSERSPNPVSKHVSCVQLYDAFHNTVMPGLYLNDGEAALSITVGAFTKDFGKEPVLVLGCASNYDHGHGVAPPTWSSTSLRTYRFAAPSAAGPEGPLGIANSSMPRLELVHVTLLTHNDLPTAVHVCASGSFLLAGFGPSEGLHMYGWSSKHLLWKRKMCGVLSSRIVTLETISDSTSAASFTAAGYAPGHSLAAAHNTLILCGLQDRSVAVARYIRHSADTSFLMVVAVDSVPRFVSTACFVDDRTIAVADRFGSLVFLRIPPSTRLDMPETIDVIPDAELNEAIAFRARQPLEIINAFHVGQVVTSLQVVLRPPVAGVTSTPMPALVYGTVSGKIGAFIPFPVEEDAATGVYLDQIISQYFHSPVDRSLLHYRSRTTPKLHVVDGDTIQLLVQAKQLFFNTEARAAVEGRLERLRKVEESHRVQLALPPRQLTTTHDLLAKMKTLLGLPE